MEIKIVTGEGYVFTPDLGDKAKTVEVGDEVAVQIQGDALSSRG